MTKFQKILYSHQESLQKHIEEIYVLKSNVSQYITDGGRANEIIDVLTLTYTRLASTLDSLESAINLSK